MFHSFLVQYYFGDKTILKYNYHLKYPYYVEIDWTDIDKYRSG